MKIRVYTKRICFIYNIAGYFYSKSRGRSEMKGKCFVLKFYSFTLKIGGCFLDYSVSLYFMILKCCLIYVTDERRDL